MFKNKLSEEARYGVIFVLALLTLLFAMYLLSIFLGGAKDSAANKKESERTVIITQSKQSPTPHKPTPESLVSTVRDAIKQGNYSTAYMEINNISKDSPEYKELNKLIAEDTQRRKAPGVRKETGVSESAPIRYFDESTPRNRTSDAIYVYFVDISGTLWPRFCAQFASKKPLGLTGFTITADNKNININAASIKIENTENGVAEWYDAPLDRQTYDAVQAMLKAKKVILTAVASRGKSSREVTENEIKGMRRVLDGYAALGGNLNYLQIGALPLSAPKGGNKKTGESK